MTKKSPDPSKNVRYIGLNMKAEANISKYIKRQVNDIIKSTEDKRLYRGYELTNGLQILLISDSETDKSAAALDVNVGYMNDPVKIPGLAHFCEHMLFMGTAKYPIENDYDNFLSTHGGGSNAHTGTDCTNFYFEVAPDHLSGAIDRFANFFISPLFHPESTDREVMAVDSEFCDSVQNDSDRLLQLEKHLSKETHDYRKFNCGNRTTLLDDLLKHKLDPREELIKFYGRHYSANLMRIAVLGKETLEQLTELVVPLFSQILDKNLTRPAWPEHPYGSEQLAKKIHLVPIKDLRTLYLYFPIPDLLPYYKSKPEHYVSHLLGHEGRGSFLYELKRRGWANELMAEAQNLAHGFGLFAVEIDLSPQGLDNVDEIITLFFRYLKVTLSDNQPQHWIHKEVENLNRIHFRFADKKNADDYVSSLSALLHDYSIEEILFGPHYMMSEFDPKIINELVGAFNPQNLLVMVAAKDFEGKTEYVEEWFGTKYSIFNFTSSLIDRFNTASNGPNIDFKLPRPNEFIPSKFTVLSSLAPWDGSRTPEILLNDPVCRLWYKMDSEYLTPKCSIFVQIRSPMAYDTPAHFVACYLLLDMLKDFLSDYTYDAKLSGLDFTFDNNQYGFSIKLEGYNEKQLIYLSRIMKELCQFELDPNRFDLLKERYVRYLRDFDQKQPYKQIKHYLSLVLFERMWDNSETLKEAEAITVAQLQNLRSVFFTAIHIEAMVHGNATREESRKILQVVKDNLEQHFQVKPLFTSQLRHNRIVCLPDGSNCVFEMENKTHSNSAIAVVFQTNLENPLQNMLTELIQQIICEPFYDQLRTKEQLELLQKASGSKTLNFVFIKGYIVCSSVHNYNGVRNLCLTVQGSRSPLFMEKRVEAFVSRFQKFLEKMPIEEFEEQKASLASMRLEKPRNLSELSDKFWSEITRNQYHFARDRAEIEMLNSIKQDEVSKFFKVMAQQLISKGIYIREWAKAKKTVNSCFLSRKMGRKEARLYIAIQQWKSCKYANSSNFTALLNLLMHDSRAGCVVAIARAHCDLIAYTFHQGKMTDVQREVLTNNQGLFIATSQYGAETASSGTEGIARCIEVMVQRDDKNRALTKRLSQEIRQMATQRSKFTVKLQTLRKRTAMAATDLADTEGSLQQFLTLPTGVQERSLKDAEAILEHMKAALIDEQNVLREKDALYGQLKNEYDNLAQQQVKASVQSLTVKPRRNVVPVIREIEQTFSRDVFRVLRLPPQRCSSSPMVFVKEIVGIKDRYGAMMVDYKLLFEKLEFLNQEYKKLDDQLNRRKQHRVFVEVLPLGSSAELEQLARQRIHLQVNILRNIYVAIPGVSGGGLWVVDAIPRQLGSLDAWLRDLNEWALNELERGREVISHLKQLVENSLHSAGVDRRHAELQKCKAEFEELHQRLLELQNQNKQLNDQLDNVKEDGIKEKYIKPSRTVIVERQATLKEQGPKISRRITAPPTRGFEDTIRELSKIRDRQNAELDALRNAILNLQPAVTLDMVEIFRQLQDQLLALTPKKTEAAERLANAKVSPFKKRTSLIDHPDIISIEHVICELDAEMQLLEHRTLSATKALRRTQHAIQNARQEAARCSEDLPHKEEINRRLFQRLGNAQRRMKEIRQEALLEKEKATFYLPTLACQAIKNNSLVVQNVAEGPTFTEVMTSQYTLPPTTVARSEPTVSPCASRPLAPEQCVTAQPDATGRRFSSDGKAKKVTKTTSEKSKVVDATEISMTETEEVFGARHRLMSVNVKCADIRVTMMTQTLPALVNTKTTTTTVTKTTEDDQTKIHTTEAVASSTATGCPIPAPTRKSIEQPEDELEEVVKVPAKNRRSTTFEDK